MYSVLESHTVRVLKYSILVYNLRVHKLRILERVTNERAACLYCNIGVMQVRVCTTSVRVRGRGTNENAEERRPDLGKLVMDYGDEYEVVYREVTLSSISCIVYIRVFI